MGALNARARLTGRRDDELWEQCFLIQVSDLAFSEKYLCSNHSIKSRQQHNVIFRHLFHGATHFAPCGQAAGNYVGFESLFSEHMRHTGAGSFPYSSAIEINVFMLG